MYVFSKIWTWVITLGVIAFYIVQCSNSDDLSKKTSLLPPDEIKFLTTAKSWSDQYSSDSNNEYNQSHDIITRKDEICAIIYDSTFQNWIVNFDRLSDDFNILTLDGNFGNDVSITGHLSISDNSILSSFKQGDRLIISGTFDKDTDSCFSTTGIINDMSMMSPDFLVTITSVQKMN